MINACLAPLAIALLAGAAHAQVQVDQRLRHGIIGGAQPGEVVVQLAPGEAFMIPGVLLRPVDLSASPTGRAIAALDAEGLRHIRPLFPNAADRALAQAIGLDRYYLAYIDPAIDSAAAAARLGNVGSNNADHTAISLAQPNTLGGILNHQVFPNDADFINQYSLHNDGQFVPGGLLSPGSAGTPDADMDVAEAWVLAQGSADVTIAIIDTGVSHSHPELAAARVPGQNFDALSVDTDDSIIISHGTHVAAIAAATGDNGIGIAGVAHGAKIMPIKVLDLIGSGTAAVGAQGVVWATDNGADIINLSLGYEGESAPLHSAIQYAVASGVVVVAAAGNDPLPAVPIPAQYPEVIAVGATDHNDQLADFSTEGPEIDVSAPGFNVWSAWDDFLTPDSYTAQSGTSMASPNVAGVVALMLDANPNLTPTEVRTILETTAEDLGPAGWDPGFGHGRVNAYAAVLAAGAPSACSPADLTTDGTSNGQPDGAVTLSDFSYYLALWSTGDLDADLTTFGTSNGVPDGDVSLSDFSYYLAEWSLGCP
ncbi:MAG: S8 family serine peptidase [Planctomycetota bacterium]